MSYPGMITVFDLILSFFEFQEVRSGRVRRNVYKTYKA